ncbi:MAG: acyl-CoA dehydrogenase family protein, partial [Chloroflexi bacterium]|nr:acyl-CoA dehydrogenase family protein [Chloroflexota bacterium]
MDFRFTAEQERFRAEIGDFLKKELTPEMRAEMMAHPEEGSFNKEFSKKLAKKGWIGIAWPKEYGGLGLGYIERLIYNEEMTYRQAPTAYHHTSERQMGPSIILHGTDWQKKEFLPKITQADICFCIGYTEPGAGSDLASLQTRAVEDGDDFVVNGQKIYTSGAHVSDWIWLATRTDTNAPKHKGISILLVDLKSPGITVRPLWTMAGGRFNEVYFDSLRVPKRNLVGEKNRGWYVLMANLDFERSGIERVTENLLVLQELVRYVNETKRNGRPLAQNPLVRQRLAELAIEFQAGRMLSYRVAWLQSKGVVPNYEASMAKAFGSELGQRVAHVGMQILGLYGQLGP